MLECFIAECCLLLLFAQALVCKAAADAAASAHGIKCNVIDLRTLLPWDVDAGGSWCCMALCGHHNAYHQILLPL